MTNCHILRKVIILQSHLIRGEKEKQQLFYFWYTLSKMFFLACIKKKHVLLQLFMKYNVSIGFTCADCSDTYGLYDDHIVIQDNNSRENVLEADGWWLNISHLR